MLSVYMALRTRPLPEVAAARAERMRALDADVAGVEREGVAALHAVPLERLEVELGHDRSSRRTG